MKKVKEIKAFRGVRMNLDVAPELAQPNEVREVYNMIEDALSGKISNMKGFENVLSLPVNTGFAFSSGANKCIGTCRDVEGSAIIYFILNDRSNHGIVSMDTVTKRLTWVLKDDPLLNFKTGYKVKANVIQGLLYWTDGYFGSFLSNDFNPPRKVNIAKAMDGISYSQMTTQTLDLIKWPPSASPFAEYITDTSIASNNLHTDLFQFAYRWVYRDYEKSVLSPLSNIALPTVSMPIGGNYGDNQFTDNCIRVAIFTGTEDVLAIEVFVRKNNIGQWLLLDKIYKVDDNGNQLYADNTEININFHNNESLAGADQADLARPFDFVPQIAKNLEIIEKNRLLLSDYIEGYDNVSVDVELSVTTDEPSIGDIGLKYTKKQPNTRKVQAVPAGSLTFFWYAVINIDEVYLPGFSYIVNIKAPSYRYNDPEGAMAPGISLYDIYGDFQNKKIEAQAIVNTEATTTIEEFSDAVCASLRTGNSSDSCVIGCNNYANKGFWNYTGFTILAPTYGQPWLQGSQLGIILTFTDSSGNGFSVVNDLSVSITRVKDTQSVSTWKSNDTKNFGIWYFDRAMRFGNVNKADCTSVFVPAQTEEGVSHKIRRSAINWKINHRPPEWAAYYTFGVAVKSNIYYSLYSTFSVINFIATKNTVDLYVFICINQHIIDQVEEVKMFNISAYKWEKGDRIRFVANANSSFASEDDYLTIPAVLDFEIIGEYNPVDDGTETTYLKNDLGEAILDADGNKIKDPAQKGILVPYFPYDNYGIAINNTVVEIYRTKETVTEKIYYAFGGIEPVLNPHTEQRVHGSINGIPQQINQSNEVVVPASGTFSSGDAYLRYRAMINFFPAESFSFSDYMNSEAISIGIPNISSRDAKRQRYISNLRYGGRLIQDTLVNDISRFEGADFVSLPDKHGAIHHIEEVGDTLKILQKSKVSQILIGRAGVTQPNEEGTQIISSTKDVLGTLVQQRSDFGTMHSGSAVRFESRLYWFDFDAASICRDPGNGIQNLTENFGLKSFMASKVAAFGSATNLDVVSGYDQSNEIVWWTFIDLTNSVNSFTIGFRDTGGRSQDGFVLFTHAIPDFYGWAKYTLTSFKDNAIWLHNSDAVARCNFYGTQYEYWVTVIANESPANVKRFKQIAVSTNAPVSSPDAGDITIEPCGNHPEGMVSLLKEAAFTSVQGKYVADFGRNMTTNSPTPTLDDLINGDDLEGQAMTIKLQGDQTTEHKIFTVEIEEIVNE